jgi:hypothetical protein
MGPVELERYRPTIFMAAPQFDPRGYANGELNSGVMIINVPRLKRDLPAIIDYGCDPCLAEMGFDQEFLSQFYHGTWDPLPSRYNWKPYWGTDPDVRILHWHGPKAEMAKRIASDDRFETAPLFRELVTTNRGAYELYLRRWDETIAQERIGQSHRAG